MLSKRAALTIAVALSASVFAAAAVSLDGDLAYEKLCANGKPRPRAQIHRRITYGYLLSDPCCERDHFISLGLCVESWCDRAAPNPRLPPTGGGGTNPGNVWYQSYPYWRIWDVRERTLERNYCAGRIERMDAWQKLIDGKEGESE